MRTESIWTQERDYALAFGAALGMSAARIAESMGDVTRNAVIGRANRIGLGLHGKPRYVAPAPETDASHAGKLKNLWTAEQDAILTAGVAARRSSKDIAAELGRTLSAVFSRRVNLGLRIFTIRRFTNDEDTIIRSDYASFVPVEDTAKKIGRSIGTLRQRILHLGLTRDARKTRLASRFGIDVLSLSDDPAEINRQMQERERQQQEDRKAAEAARVVAALEAMQTALNAGEDRVAAFQAAMLQGATLLAVGDATGISPERVRQLVHGVRAKSTPKPARTLTCRRCSAEFEGPGGRWYCTPCREVVAAMKVENLRVYQRQRRQTDEGKQYKRDWTRRSRLKEKLKAVEPAELAKLLRDVANEIDDRDGAAVIQ